MVSGSQLSAANGSRSDSSHRRISSLSVWTVSNARVTAMTVGSLPAAQSVAGPASARARIPSNRLFRIGLPVIVGVRWQRQPGLAEDSSSPRRPPARGPTGPDKGGRRCGLPVLIVHGGPGSGCTTGQRRSFDPQRHRIILFDQRNCGRSRPHASDPAADMRLNTTDHLIRDMERLREHLGVGRWLLRGGSWGVPLSLAYAERHPERVSGMVLVSVTSTRRSELDWLYRGAGRMFPEAWARFRDFAGAGRYRLPTDAEPPIEDLLMSYSRLMEDRDYGVRAQAATEWLAWEDAVISMEYNGQPGTYGSG